MTISIFGVTANDDSCGETIEDVELIAIEPIYEIDKRSENKEIWNFNIKYKEDNKIKETSVPCESEFSFDRKENKLHVYFDFY